MNEIVNMPMSYLVMLPERLWGLETGTVLTAGSDGNIEVAKNGDWVIGYAVNEGLSHYMKLVITYIKNE